MPRGQEPLLARSPTSEPSQDDHEAEEEDALLTGQRTNWGAHATGPWQRYREIFAFGWAFIATVIIIVLAVLLQHSHTDHRTHRGGKHHGRHHDGLALDPAGRPVGKRNLVFMVSDGMGPHSLSLTRSFRQYIQDRPWGDTLTLDKLLVGQSRTRSSSSLVTDSAAGATAFSCGIKSYNGAISMLDDGTPCGSVMEAAKRAGYTTGLVVTTRITDATPACFASHVQMRSMEDSIAEQLVGEGVLGRSVDLILGGGRCHFLGNSTVDSCRLDDTDVVELARQKGWNYISTRKEFDGLHVGTAVDLPLLGLFAPGDIPYEIDRRTNEDVYPSLEEMTRTALRALSDATKNSEQGFFVMIEGSRIDHAGHANDPAAQVHEVLAYDAAMSAVLQFFDDDDTPGLMVATSDHETGGLALAKQLDLNYPEYAWFPSALANASHSASYASHRYHEYLASSASDRDHHNDHQHDSHTRHVLRRILLQDLGLSDVTDNELTFLIQQPLYSPWTMARMISRRAQIGWSTHGHTAADVNIYTSDRVLAERLQGNHENTEVGGFLRWWLDVEGEVREVTKELKEGMEVGQRGGDGSGISAAAAAAISGEHDPAREAAWRAVDEALPYW